MAPALLPCLAAMTNPTCRERGFTLVETLVVLVILVIAVLFSAPYLANQIQRSKLVGAASQSAGLMRMARMDAIKHSACAMVAIEVGTRKLVAFSDRDGNCRPSAPDVRLSEVILPNLVEFLSPCGAGAASVDRLTSVMGNPSVAVFRGDGSVENPGAFRIGAGEMGGRETNYLEVIVSPAATARIQLRKWRGGTGGDCDDPANWHTNGEGGGAWKWS
jgi:prepilin-type N-terminal cleavage/methylation domain-containing protein